MHANDRDSALARRFIAARSWAARRPGSARWRWPRCSTRACFAGPTRRRPASRHATPSAGAAWSIRSTSLPRSSGSSTSTWPAARRTWRRSTTSRTLARMHGQPMPESFTRGMPIAQLQGQKLVCFAPQHPFRRCGHSGQEISTIFPHLATVADDICIIRSMVTEAINHDPAHTFMNTGTTISGRPAMGSWLNYGLGSESDDLPGFVVLTSNGHFGQAQPIASRQWHSGFLPSRFQGVRFYSKGDPVLYLGRPQGTTADRQRDVVDAVQRARFDRERTRSTTPRSPPGSPPTRRPSGCRPACPS